MAPWHRYQPKETPPADEKKTPAWKKPVWEMTTADIVQDGTRSVALAIIPTEFPLLRDTDENYDRLDEAIERRYKGYWSPETVRYCIQYEKNNLIWNKPAPPPQPVPPPTPVYDEGPLKTLSDGSWQLPLDTPEWKLRSPSVSKEQMRDLVERLRKFEAWRKEIGE
jgi:hypothetical protein